MLDKIDKIAIIFFLLSIILLGIISYENLKYEATTNPDFLQNIFFSKLLADTGSLKYCNQYNLDYNTFIFGSRGFKLTTDPHCLTHGSMHGFIIILGILRVISDKIIYFIVPFFAVIALVFFYKLCNLFFTKEISLIGIALLLFSSSFFFHSVILVNNIPAMSFLTLTLYYFLRAFKDRKEKDLILCSIFAGIMMWIRYEFVIFLLPLVVPFLRKKDRGKFRIKNFVLPFIIFFIFLAGLYWVNLELYGGLFNFKGTEETRLASSEYYGKEVSTYKILSFLPPFSPSLYFENFLRFVVNFNPFIFIFFLFSILFLLGHKQKRNKIFFNNSFWILISIFIIPIVFYLGSVWSEKEYIVATAYSRYLLPTYSMMVLFSLFLIKKLNKKLLMFCVFIFLLFNISISFNSPGALKDFNLSQKTFIDKQKDILKNIPEENAVVFTAYFDKYIFPKRTTAIYTSFPENERINKTTSIILNLTEDNVPTYFLNEDWGIGHYTKFKSEEYFNVFKENGLVVKRITRSIFKIEKQD